MNIPHGATSFTPRPQALLTGTFRGASIRHTFRPKGTEDWLLIYTIDGAGLYQGARGKFVSRRGDITLYRPGVFQDYQVNPGSSRWELFYAHFIPRPDWIAWLNWPENEAGLGCLRLEDVALQRQIRRRWLAMIQLNAGSHSRARVFGQNALEEILLWCDSVNPELIASQMDPRVRKGMEFLSEQLTRPFSERALSRAAGLSPSRLRHLFQKEAGTSPRKFLEEKRMLHARDLLVFSRQTIAEIALSLGFDNPFYFTLRFKKHSGENPRQYRQRRLGQG